MQFDLVVLGSETPGLLVAAQAADLGHRVAVADDPKHFRREFGQTHQAKLPPRIPYFSGFTKFATDESLEITNSRQKRYIDARRFVFACGSRARRPSHIPFDGGPIRDSDDVWEPAEVPQSVLVVGAGRHGCACAGQLLTMGTKVSLVDQRKMPPQSQAPVNERLSGRIHWGTTVLGVERCESRVRVFHGNGSFETYGGVVFAVGREGCTDRLNLPRSDMLLDETGRFWCTEAGQTEIPKFYAVGSVVGFPRRFLDPAEEAAQVISQAFPQESLCADLAG